MDIYDSLEKTLRQYSPIKYGEFTLANGKKSKYYVDIKKVMTNPKALKTIAYNMAREINYNCDKIDYIACIELGGVPLGTAISLQMDLPTIIIRKDRKEYGIKDKIIGDIKKGKKAVLVEDVTTTGESIIDATQILRENGININYVFTVVDRIEGDKSNIDKAGLNLIHLVNVRDLLKN